MLSFMDWWSQMTPCEFRRDLEGKEGDESNGRHVEEKALNQLLDELIEVLAREPNVLELQSPIVICGDIHGQLYDLFQLFDMCKGEAVPMDIETHRFLFLGDYVDRGYQSIETFAYLAFLKVKFPNQISLLRGNHESVEVNQMYGLHNDCVRLYGSNGIWFRLNEVFNYMPIAAVIDKNRIFCVHGGLSPRARLIEQIATVDRNTDIVGGVIADLTWSDPEEVRGYCPNRRGKGFVFGPDQTEEFLRNNGFTEKYKRQCGGFIARSHQLAREGVQWMHKDQCVIVWSAPNYAYKENNRATVMVVPEGVEEVRTPEFSPHQRSSTKPDEPTLSQYFA